VLPIREVSKKNLYYFMTITPFIQRINQKGDKMKRYLVIVIALSMLMLTGCETTMGQKRSNGSATEHTNAKMKNVNVYGNLTIGGARQTSDRADQDGGVKAEADAKIQDSLKDNVVNPTGL
jgi:hypothetical protein